MKRLVLVVLLAAVPAFAQSIRFGVKGGVPVTDVFRDAPEPSPGTFRLSFNSNIKRYTVGPTVEFPLPFGLALELDALYKRLGYSTSGVFPRRVSGVPIVSSNSNAFGNSWEFPLLLKYRLSGPRARPYLLGGVAMNHFSGFTQVTNYRYAVILPGLPPTEESFKSDEPRELVRRFNGGVVAGGGIQIGAGPIHVSPEIRYTRWGWKSFVDTADNGRIFRTDQNQVQFLLGITF